MRLLKEEIFERKRKFLGAEGALFRFGMKSRKLGRRRRPVLHSEEARGAAGALRKYLGALAPRRDVNLERIIKSVDAEKWGQGVTLMDDNQSST